VFRAPAAQRYPRRIIPSPIFKSEWVGFRQATFEQNNKIRYNYSNLFARFREQRAGQGSAAQVREKLTTLGKFEILEEIGRGGFAVVYKARDTTLDRIVALKVLHPQLTADPRFLQRFHQEAQAAAGLHHPHIVTVYEVGEEAGQHYLAMAFLPGRTLDELASEGPLPVESAISIIEQIAEAVDAIHGQVLVHRDVKPGNILVDDSGRATLLDFGIVRAAQGTRLTTTMTVLGTPEYMAPEQAEAEQADEIDWRADVYALGVVAYELLVGRAPFTGASPTAVLYKHVHEPPPAPTALNPDLPPGLEPVLLKVLAKQREERFQRAGAFGAALREAWLIKRPLRRQEPRLASAGLVASGLLFLVIASVVTFFVFMNGSDETEPKAIAPAESTVVTLNSDNSTSKTVVPEATHAPLQTPFLEPTDTPTGATASGGIGSPQTTSPPHSDALIPITGENVDEIRQLTHLTLGLTDVALRPDGEVLAVSDGLNVELFNIETLDPVHELKGQTTKIVSMAWSPDGTQLVLGGDNGRMRIIDAASGEELRVLGDPGGVVKSVAWSPDGTRLASGGADHFVRVWDAAAETELHVLAGHSGDVLSVAWAPDSQRLASAGGTRDNTVRVWDAVAGEQLQLMTGHTDIVRLVKWLPDGTRVASGASADGTVRVWDVESGSELLRVEGQGMAWSPDSTLLAVGDGDGTVRLLDAASGLELSSLKGHTDLVWFLAWSPDSTRLVTGSFDSSIKVWGIPSQ
jgi:serine/threonine protein kinase